jgi:L-threonylcarbamoyladenylate synthase
VNKSGSKAVTSGAAAEKIFQGKVDVIIDGGACDIGNESTVLDVTHFPFSVLREGALSKTQLARVLNLN